MLCCINANRVIITLKMCINWIFDSLKYNWKCLFPKWQDFVQDSSSSVKVKHTFYKNPHLYQVITSRFRFTPGIKHIAFVLVSFVLSLVRSESSYQHRVAFVKQLEYSEDINLAKVLLEDSAVPVVGSIVVVTHMWALWSQPRAQFNQNVYMSFRLVCIHTRLR